MSYRGCSSYRGVFPGGPRAIFRRAVGHVEHPGPNMSFSHGDAETQEEQGRLPRHLGHEESRWRKRGQVIQDCQDPGSHSAFYIAGGP